MATIVAKSSHVSPVMTVQEKGSRNKRKFRADPSLPIASQKLVSTLQPECFPYEFSAEKFECHEHGNGCDMCSFSHENTDSIKLDLALSCTASDGFHDADWSDLTESQLEELVLMNLDTMFKTAVKKIVSCGYTDEAAIKGILKSGLCCGCHDIVSSIVENALITLKNERDTDLWKENEHGFENLQQVEKYLLTELVCVVRELRPSFSAGDAMWCLLITDMNVSQACALDGDEPCTLNGQCVRNCVYESPSKPNSRLFDGGFTSRKTITRPVNILSENREVKPVLSRKINGISKKPVPLDKSYRSKSRSRSKRLILDKNASFKTNNTKNTSTELSLSLGVKPESPMNFSATRYDKPMARWTPHDRRDEAISKLVPRVHDLQNQLQLWTEWANQKVMQAARRLGKEKTELKTLRHERQEVERLKKEKKALEDNTMKKLTEMENALTKASNQVGRADAAVRRLEVENANLRLKMEAANLQAAESAASCDEVAKREKKTLMQLQFWEKQKILFREELITERRKLGQLKEDLEVAKEERDQLETKWKQEEKSKQELINQAIKIKIERQESEVLAKSREDLTRLKADKTLKKYQDDINKLEKEISLLRLKSDSSKIAALRQGVDGSYASKLNDTRHIPDTVTDTVTVTVTVTGGVKRERECVMCLSDEMSVVFLPCAHQVVCTKCNELHEKQGMKDCPSCRGPIQQRVPVRYARV